MNKNKISGLFIAIIMTMSIVSATTISGTGVSTFTKDLKIESTSGNGDLWVYRNLGNASTSGTVAFIEQDHVQDDQSALTVQNDGSGIGVWLDQNGNGRGLSIDSEATTLTNYGFQVDTVTADPAIFSSDASTYAVIGHTNRTLATFVFNRDAAAAATQSPVMIVIDDNAGDDQGALTVKQDGDGWGIAIQSNGATGRGLYLDHNSNAAAIDIDAESTSEPAILINQLATTAYASLADLDSASGLFYFYKNQAAAASVAPMAYFFSDEPTDDNPVITIENDGVGQGLFLNQDGNAIALYIDSEATTARSLQIDHASNDDGIFIEASAEIGANNVLIYGRSNVAQTQAGSYIGFMQQDHASSTSNAFGVQNDGTGNGLFIDQNGNGAALNIDSEATTEAAITINQLATTMFSHMADLDSTLGGYYFYKNQNAAASVAPMAYFYSDEPTDDNTVIEIENDGVGKGVYIDSNAEGLALQIDSASTTNPALYIDAVASNKPAVQFASGVNGGCAAGVYGIYTNSTNHLLYCRNGVSTYIGD